MNFSPAKVLNRWRVLFAMILTGVALSSLSTLSHAAEPGAPAKKTREAKITVSKATTFVTGPLTKDGFVDYRAAINQHFSIGVTAKNNAVVPLIQAIGPRPENSELPDEFFDRLGIKRLPEKGDYFIDLLQYTRELAENSNPPRDFDTLWKDVEAQWIRTLDAPWQAKEFPLIDDWLKQNEKPLALVVEGTKRPRYYYPSVEPDDELLYLQLLPLIQEQREVARKLSMRALRKIGEGDLDGAWEDQMAMHRLARLLSQGPTLIEMLVGFAIDGIASQGDLLVAHHDKLTAAQARRMQREYESLPPFRSVVECINFGERLSYLEIAQALARSPGQEVDTLLRLFDEEAGEGEWVGKNYAALTKLIKAAPVHWDRVMRNGNDWFDRLVAAMRKPSYKEREAAFGEVAADLQRSQQVWDDLPKIAETFPMGIQNPEQWVSETIADGLAALLMPAVRVCTHVEIRSTSRIKVTKLAFPLAAYRMDHGQYPAKLNQLTPRYIDAVPKDPLGNDIEYTTDAKSYTLRIPDTAKIKDIVAAAPDHEEDG